MPAPQFVVRTIDTSEVIRYWSEDQTLVSADSDKVATIYDRQEAQDVVDLLTEAGGFAHVWYTEMYYDE